MPDTLINGIPISEILRPLPDNEALVERIAHRKVPLPLEIVEPDPQWPTYFETFKFRILSAFLDHNTEEQGDINALQPTILSISHVGSTSVPSLPAKAVIDIDLVLSSNTRLYEAYYVPRLESAGFQFNLREPQWYEHRFFVAAEPIACNLHVWGPGCALAERHRIFRDWLKTSPSDCELYARVKRECAARAREKGEGMNEYSRRKDEVVAQIMVRACKGTESQG